MGGSSADWNGAMVGLEDIMILLPPTTLIIDVHYQTVTAFLSSLRTRFRHQRPVPIDVEAESVRPSSASVLFTTHP